MSCSVIIKTEDGKERRVCVDSEEELKNMTVKEFRRRFCPEHQRRSYKLYFHEEPEDDQTRGSRCCLFYTHKQPEDYQTQDKELKDDQTLGSYGIREGCTILEEGPAVLYCYCISGDYDNEVPRTGSMEKVADMQQTESISRSCIIQ